MELHALLELLTYEKGLDSNLAPLMHENSKLWPYQIRSGRGPVRADYLPAHRQMAEATPGIVLSNAFSTGDVLGDDLNDGVPFNTVAKLLLSTSLPKQELLNSGDVGGVNVRSYLLAWRVQGLASGSYLYWPSESKLISVRKLVSDSIGERVAFDPAILNGSAGMVVLCGAISYDGQPMGERYYRDLLLTAGCLSNDLVRTAAEFELSAGIFAGFLDDPLALELGVDPVYEQPLVAVVFGNRDTNGSGGVL